MALVASAPSPAAPLLVRRNLQSSRQSLAEFIQLTQTQVFETELVGIAGVKPPAKAEEAAPEGEAKTAKVNLLEALRRVVCGRSPLT